MLQVGEKHCLELIAADLLKNDKVVSYPSTLGQDCNTKERLQLVLFLVCIHKYKNTRKFEITYNTV